MNFYSKKINLDIPLGEVHSLENVGDNDLELIEVQSGNYLGEDDIVGWKRLWASVVC